MLHSSELNTNEEHSGQEHTQGILEKGHLGLTFESNTAPTTKEWWCVEHLKLIQQGLGVHYQGLSTFSLQGASFANNFID